MPAGHIVGSGRSLSGNGYIGNASTAWSCTEESKESNDHVCAELFTRCVADVGIVVAEPGL